METLAIVPATITRHVQKIVAAILVFARCRRRGPKYLRSRLAAVIVIVEPLLRGHEVV